VNRDAEIARIWQEALDRPAADRLRYVSEACRGDEPLLYDVETLLAHSESADRFLPAPAFEVEAERLAAAGREAHRALVGETLSHYRIVSHLAAGGMEVVYKTIDTRLGRAVAFKLIVPHAAGDADSRRRFVREARAASALNHPNIVSIHDIESCTAISSRPTSWFPESGRVKILDFGLAKQSAEVRPVGGVTGDAAVDWLDRDLGPVTTR